MLKAPIGMHQCPQRIIITFLTLLASSNLWASGAQESRKVLSLLGNQLDTEIQAVSEFKIKTLLERRCVVERMLEQCICSK